MPFRCTILSSTLQTVLRGLEGMNATVVLTVRDGFGLMGMVQDESLIALCDWVIKESAFEDFSFYQTTRTQIILRVRVQSLFKFLAGGDKTELVELYLNDNPTFLGLNYDGEQAMHAVDYIGKMPLEKMTEEDKERANARIPCEYHEDRVLMKSSTFRDVIGNLGSIAPNIKIYASPHEFEFHVEDKTHDVNGKMSLPVKDENDPDDDWVDLSRMTSTFEQRFPINFLKLFAACSTYVNEVELFFAKESMLILRYLLPQRHGYVSYFIAPLLQADGRRDQDAMVVE